jgi:hypothetical protein
MSSTGKVACMGQSTYKTLVRKSEERSTWVWEDNIKIDL